MTHTTISQSSRKPLTGLKASFTLSMLLAATGLTYSAELPTSLSGKASDALITLATTGNPDPLHAELGGTVISSEDIQKRANTAMKLQSTEHLAPKALVTPTGEIYAMVAPTITKDNFILVDRQGNLLRVDVGDSEGHRTPFVVETVVADGGTPWYVEFWRWITFQ